MILIIRVLCIVLICLLTFQKSNNQSLSVDVASQQAAAAAASTHTRPMYRFGQNDSGTTNGTSNNSSNNGVGATTIPTSNSLAYLNNNTTNSVSRLAPATAANSSSSSSSSSNIKRSVSQVPSSDRRALAQQQQQSNGSGSTNAIANPTSNEFLNSFDSTNAKNVDFQVVRIFFFSKKCYVYFDRKHCLFIAEFLQNTSSYLTLAELFCRKKIFFVVAEYHSII